MSRTTKIILFIAAPLLASCCLFCVAVFILAPRLMSNAIATGPQAAQQVGTRIADYTLPRGYQELMGMDLFTTQYLIIAPSDQRTGTMIMLMQFKSLTAANYDPKQMEQQMQQALQGQYARTGTFQPAGQRPVTIKGETVNLAISEGIQGSARIRQATGIFTGRNGLVMLMITGDASTWDWKMIENFCGSIR